MKRIRLLAIIEANTITGPAKNLLNFGEMARQANETRSIDLSIVVFQRPGASDLFVNKARALSIPVYTIPEAGRFDRSVLARMRSLAVELQPHLVQTHAVKSHLLLRISGLHKSVPWIAFHHGYTWTDVTMRLYNQLDRWSLRAAERIVTVSVPFRQQLARLGVNPARVEVVHNAIDPNWASAYRTASARSALRTELNIPANRKIVLIVGRLSLEKDHRTLLQAIHRVNSKLSAGGASPAHLVIVGEGPERSRIEQTIRELELAQFVTMVGQAPSAEPYYGIADISVLSSRTEGSPNALLESMAAKVPAVATPVGGVPEIVSDGETALLVKTGDAAGMAEAIGSLISNPELAGRISEAAHQSILTRFTPEGRFSRLVDIYDSTLVRHAG